MAFGRRIPPDIEINNAPANLIGPTNRENLKWASGDIDAPGDPGLNPVQWRDPNQPSMSAPYIPYVPPGEVPEPPPSKLYHPPLFPTGQPEPPQAGRLHGTPLPDTLADLEDV